MAYNIYSPPIAFTPAPDRLQYYPANAYPTLHTDPSNGPPGQNQPYITQPAPPPIPPDEVFRFVVPWRGSIPPRQEDDFPDILDSNFKNSAGVTLFQLRDDPPNQETNIYARPPSTTVQYDATGAPIPPSWPHIGKINYRTSVITTGNNSVLGRRRDDLRTTLFTPMDDELLPPDFSRTGVVSALCNDQNGYFWELFVTSTRHSILRTYRHPYENGNSTPVGSLSRMQFSNDGTFCYWEFSLDPAHVQNNYSFAWFVVSAAYFHSHTEGIDIFASAY